MKKEKDEYEIRYLTSIPTKEDIKTLRSDERRIHGLFKKALGCLPPSARETAKNVRVQLIPAGTTDGITLRMTKELKGCSHLVLVLFFKDEKMEDILRTFFHELAHLWMEKHHPKLATDEGAVKKLEQRWMRIYKKKAMKMR